MICFVKEKLSKIQFDYLYITILFIVIITMFILTYGNLYNSHSDIGREFYIPSQMLQGEVLYKDIYNIYPPLGYFINAILLKIFGDSVNTFYFIGLFLSIIILIPIYKLVKSYCDSHTAFFTVLTLIFTCIYNPSFSNWITPYSYPVLYSLAAIIWAVYYTDKFLDCGKYKYIIYSSFLYGFSIASKYEFLLYFIVILISLFYKKAKFKQYIFVLFSSLMIPLISFLILLIQGCSLNILLNSVKLILLQGSKEALEFFYMFIGFIPTIGSIKRMFIPSFDTLFSPIVIICLIILLYEIYKKYSFRILILTFSAVVLSLKCFFFVDLRIYGTYILPILLLSLVIFVHFSFKNRNISKYIYSLFLIISLSYFSYSYDTNYFYDFKPIKTVKGTVKIDSLIYDNINESVKYLNNYTNDKDVILCIPEGILINYLTGRKSDNYLFYMIYPNVLAFGNDYIINKIQNEKYNYIIYSNIKYVHHNQNEFKDSWGSEIYKVIENNYKPVKTINNELQDTYILKYKD
jgi:hypothetical protein